MEVSPAAKSVVYRLNPLADPRWEEFLRGHPRATVFHSTPWIEALCRSYGYEPAVLTTSPPDAPLRNGLAVCRIDSRLTGRRLVSLPFSDHCEPLLDENADWRAVFSSLDQELRRRKLRYVEIRPVGDIDRSLTPSSSTHAYCLHQLDLTPPLDALFQRFHKSSIQRKIHRAGKEQLHYEEGRTDPLLEAFYNLLLITRRRHELPPQPRIWFRNLIDSFKDTLKIRVALKEKTPIAAILTLRFKDTLVYKYGGSAAQYHNLGGMHLLFWKTIQEGKRAGLHTFDFGRSDYDNEGLITFKDRWGATRSTLNYFRITNAPQSNQKFIPTGADWKGRIATRVLSRLQPRMTEVFADWIYKHIG
ncbi:MAG: hypothetical protein IANPNBLG_04730 [Bryobacteraceae bacterium]|nr:hypothetical protein [Bryobacteraceae bacterium]